MTTLNEKKALRLKDMILSTTEPDVQMKMIDTLANSYTVFAEGILLDLIEKISDSDVRKHALQALQEVKSSY